MRLAVVSDIHGSLSFLPGAAEALMQADLVVIAGDITTFGTAAAARSIVESIQALNASVVAVHGNCDCQGIEAYLAEGGMSLHGRCKTVDDHVFLGVGGSLPCPGTTPNEIGEKEFERILGRAMGENTDQDKPLILVSHQPAYGTQLDRVSRGHFSGSQAIRAFIEQHQPVLAISGHIHEAMGIDRMGDCTLVNPGSFKQGHFATIDVKDGQVRAGLEHLA